MKFSIKKVLTCDYYSQMAKLCKQVKPSFIKETVASELLSNFGIFVDSFKFL